MSSEPKPGSLLTGWKITSVWKLLGSAFLSSLLIRIFLTFLRSFDLGENLSYMGTFWRNLLGVSIGRCKIQPDHLHPLVLGFIECSCFPVLIVLGYPTYVGVWIGFKAVAQWKVWGDNRVAFNRFLMGTALVVILSVLWTSRYVARV